MAQFEYIRRTLVNLHSETGIDLEELENLLADYVGTGFEEYVHNSME